MELRITVPDGKEMGGDLRLLPAGIVKAVIEKVVIGRSKNNQPKATLRFVITEGQGELAALEPTVVGEIVLKTCSLQPQAMFNLNAIFKEATKENLPQGDYSEEEFNQFLNEELAGTEWTLVLEPMIPNDGISTEERTTIIKQTLAT